MTNINHLEIGPENIPNILDNDLDQAPKTGASYETRLQSTIADEVAKAFDRFYETEVDEEVIEFWFKNHKNVPIEMVIDYLARNSSVGLEIDRKEKTGTGFSPTVGSCLAVEDVLPDNILKKPYNKPKSQQEGTIVTYLICTKKGDNPLNFRVSGKVVEYPRPTAMMLKGFVYNRDVTKKDLESIVL